VKVFQLCTTCVTYRTSFAYLGVEVAAAYGADTGQAGHGPVQLYNKPHSPSHINVHQASCQEFTSWGVSVDFLRFSRAKVDR
jgi:hypothetical protein